MIPQRMVTLLQLAGAALGIPAAAAGSYTAYQTFFSAEATCQKLRTNILATMERRIAPVRGAAMGVLALALLAGGPWIGWWPLALFALVPAPLVLL